MLPPNLESTREFIYRALDFNPKTAEYFFKHAEDYSAELTAIAFAETSRNFELSGMAIRCLGRRLKNDISKG